MVFNPRDFLEIASQLFGDRRYHHEAGWRTIVGRAYYASFLASHKKLQELGESFSDTAEVHQEVIDKVMERNSTTANKLFTLRTERNKADYNWDATFSNNALPGLLRFAEIVVNDVETYKRR